MSIVDRVKNICLSPNTEWPVIERESTTPAELVSSFLLPLAVVSALAGFIGSSVVGTTLPFVGTYRTSLVSGIVAACVAVVMTVVGCFIISFIINALAPTFGARPDSNQAFKASVYSYAPGLAAGVLQILPILGNLVAVIAGLYGLYLLYLGLPVVMKAPQDKALPYAVVIVVCSIVLMVIIAGILGVLGLAGASIAG